MPKTDLVELLSRTGLLRSLSQDKLSAIAAAGTLRAVEEDSYYFMQGDEAKRLYVLTLGRVRLMQVTADGQQVALRIITPGQMFGALGITQEQPSYPASAQAVEDSQAITWENKVFQKFVEQNPNLSFNLMGLMTGYIQEMQDRFRELATERVEQRVARTLLRLAAQTGKRVEKGVLIDMLVSRQGIAELTGTTLFTVSRLFSDWERQGLIETGRERVTLINPHKLVQIAEDLER